MSENNDKPNQVDGENNKNNNPLSVRVDPYYKDIFEDLIKQKGIPKKVLLETMISSYVESGSEDEREANISFVNEINLIAGNFNEILNTFKAMATKSQDTIGSQKSFNEQKIKNLETRIQVLETDYKDIEEKNKLLEATNKNHSVENETLNKKIIDMNGNDASSIEEISSYIRKNAELLEHITILQKAEKEFVLLRVEYEKEKSELKALKLSLEDKISENIRLQKKISDAYESIMENKNKKAEEFKELELLIRKDAEIDKKMEILKFQMQYNELQAENIKNLGIINEQLKK